MTLERKILNRLVKKLELSLTDTQISQATVIIGTAIRESLSDNVLDGIYTDGGHHKQEYLISIAKTIGIKDIDEEDRDLW